MPAVLNPSFSYAFPSVSIALGYTLWSLLGAAALKGCHRMVILQFVDS